SRQSPWNMRSPAPKRLAAVAILAAAPIPLALAQDGGARPKYIDSDPPPATAAATTSPAAAATGAAPHAEATDAEEEHPTPAPKPAPVTRPPVVMKDGMVRIPGGRFTMGSDEKKAPPNERPSRVVVVSPFWIDRTEVTVGAYRTCVDRGACPRPARSS